MPPNTMPALPPRPPPPPQPAVPPPVLLPPAPPIALVPANETPFSVTVAFGGDEQAAAEARAAAAGEARVAAGAALRHRVLDRQVVDGEVARVGEQAAHRVAAVQHRVVAAVDDQRDAAVQVDRGDVRHRGELGHRADVADDRQDLAVGDRRLRVQRDRAADIDRQRAGGCLLISRGDQRIEIARAGRGCRAAGEGNVAEYRRRVVGGRCEAGRHGGTGQACVDARHEAIGGRWCTGGDWTGRVGGRVRRTRRYLHHERRGRSDVNDRAERLQRKNVVVIE